MTTPDRLLDRLLADPSARSMEEILRWLREAAPGANEGPSPRMARLVELARAIEAHERSSRVVAKVREVWTHPTAVRLIAETGLPVHGTLVKESVERLVDRIVPRLHPSDDLFVMLSHLDLAESDAAWVEGLSDEDAAPWGELIATPDPLLVDAARLVALRAAARGIGRELLELDASRPDGGSPFLELPAAVDGLLEGSPTPEAEERFRRVRAECDACLRAADRELDRHGVSTDLLYQVELLAALLARLDLVLETLAGRTSRRVLAGELVRGSVRQRGVRSLARNSLKRLALKVTEHTAETGEHYQVRDRAEWEATGRSAAGGGAVTAFTALFKYGIAAAPLAPVVQGLAAALNYSASFVAMQLAHFTLASKQPAMTGAALATALADREDLERQVELVARIARSQMAATIGNVFATIPVSVAIVAGFRLAGSGPPLGAETAVHAVHAVHPLLSGTVPFAMITGAFLWLASLAAGWAANWSAYRGLPEALARHRGLIGGLGAAGAERLGRFVDRHLSGIAGYLVLGFLLGFVPVAFDRFAGLPLEVRHVTLQAASLALAAGSLYGTEAFRWGDLAWGGLGIVLIAAGNLGVSFLLALRTAARARDLAPPERRRLAAALRAAFRADPKRFLWRPPDGSRVTGLG